MDGDSSQKGKPPHTAFLQQAGQVRQAGGVRQANWTKPAGQIGRKRQAGKNQQDKKSLDIGSWDCFFL